MGCRYFELIDGNSAGVDDMALSLRITADGSNTTSFVVDGLSAEFFRLPIREQPRVSVRVNRFDAACTYERGDTGCEFSQLQELTPIISHIEPRSGRVGTIITILGPQPMQARAPIQSVSGWWSQ